jgi:hypothetical protein
VSAIPLHLQRRFEQRWAARFVSPVASAAAKGIGSKGTVQSLPRPASKRKTRRVESAGLSSDRGVSFERPRSAKGYSGVGVSLLLIGERRSGADKRLNPDRRKVGLSDKPRTSD